MVRTVVAMKSPKLTDTVSLAIESAGIKIRYRCRSGAEVLRAVKKMGGGLIVCSYLLPDMTANELHEYTGENVPMLVVAKPQYLDYCKYSEIHKLAMPLKKSDLVRAAKALLAEEQEISKRMIPQRSEEDKKIITESKRLLMEKYGMTEPEAHSILQKYSMSNSLSMVEASRQFLEKEK